MAENSKIAWTHHTFNPWIGCAKVSAGCQHCYAENLMDTRYGKVQWGPQGTRVRTSDSNWQKPLKWDREAKAAGVRARVFCASLADVFEQWEGPILSSGKDPVYIGRDGRASNGPASRMTMNDMRRDLFDLIDETPHLDWLLLTKRPENVRKMWALPAGALPCDMEIMSRAMRRHNVWLGTSIESQDEIGRWDHLAKCEDLAQILWCSAEPLLGPLDVSTMPGCQWIVFGGESDQGEPARPCHVEWIRSGVRQCLELGIAPFVKQLGSRPMVNVYDSFTGDIRGVDEWRAIKCDKAGADPSEWPEDLRVREFPR